MKAMRYAWILLVVLMFGLSSCEAIGDIFQAGMTAGIVVVIIVVIVIIWLVSRFRR
jgi:TRAP-type C4-dicarboxylate transport system permease large subunit